MARNVEMARKGLIVANDGLQWPQLAQKMWPKMICRVGHPSMSNDGMVPQNSYIFCIFLAVLVEDKKKFGFKESQHIPAEGGWVREVLRSDSGYLWESGSPIEGWSLVGPPEFLPLPHPMPQFYLKLKGGAGVCHAN